ncbi:asparagine rich protein [Reticulomyxa filosa]|uniref:Asparagine rich protein n=1 Tax=Reticulomyxa filosa TaxID=46433 RepID=X6M362_RETFI|nr:asparagine rich protein [Reticulomyxa filosa]|eukprot:ETO07902.1 asparagine rich protein [Reticulomyxa filosa]
MDECCDLCQQHELNRSEEVSKNCIDFNKSQEKNQVFLEFFNLTGILGERLFDVFDTKQDNVINFDKFVTGLAWVMRKNYLTKFSKKNIEHYNRGTMKEKIDMLFEMYALNGQSYITKEQLQAIFFSLVTPTSGIFYSDDPIRIIGVSKVNYKKKIK